MEAAVVDPGSSLLKAGFAIPDQAPAMVRNQFSPQNLVLPLLLFFISQQK